MSEDKSNPEVKTVQPKARKTIGREEMFDVFKAGGEPELFARPAQKKKYEVETETRMGPSIHHQIHDASSPIVNNQSTDALGPSIDHRISDNEGPTINRTEIVDAAGPSIAHQMNDAKGPVIKKTEIVDAADPTTAHQMRDATGPVIKRTLDNTFVKLPTLPNTPISITQTNDTSSNHQQEKTTHPEKFPRAHTFSINLAERIAKIKSAQKETRAKMDELEANSQVIQGKTTPKV
jgi:hypothetical protein